MNLKKWWSLFSTTLVIGTLASVIIGLILFFAEMDQFSTKMLIVALLQYFFLGLLFSVISHVGLFAFLWLQSLGLSFFKNSFVWVGILLIITVVLYVDLIYFDVMTIEFLGQANAYILPTALLIVALVVAAIKSKLTNRKAFIPTLFLFMF